VSRYVEVARVPRGPWQITERQGVAVTDEEWRAFKVRLAREGKRARWVMAEFVIAYGKGNEHG
jgi:hypothetical protein